MYLSVLMSYFCDSRTYVSVSVASVPVSLFLWALRTYVSVSVTTDVRHGISQKKKKKKKKKKNMATFKKRFSYSIII